MKKFEAPVMEVETFAVEDILTTSGDAPCTTDATCSNETDGF